jgi:lipoprotein-anchoring transpeptidase ErfK/SrfK
MRRGNSPRRLEAADRYPRIHRLIAPMKKPTIASLVCLLTIGVLAPAAQAAGHTAIAPHQETVTLLTNHSVRNRPSAEGKVVALVKATRPITGERTVLPVLPQTSDHNGGSWLRVRLPGRVLGQSSPPATGWITASNTVLSSTAWHILVVLNTRRLFLYSDGRPVRSFPAIVGKPSTPTPAGQYFVEENVQLSANDPGAPFALATSDRSKVLQEFDGGPGQIAIHGLEDLGGQLGTAESHGCVRLADSSITWLAARIGPGVPVTIIN